MLETYKPDIGELGFRQGLMADPETMSYNAAWGGTIPFPQEERACANPAPLLPKPAKKRILEAVFHPVGMEHFYKDHFRRR